MLQARLLVCVRLWQAPPVGVEQPTDGQSPGVWLEAVSSWVISIECVACALAGSGASITACGTGRSRGPACFFCAVASWDYRDGAPEAATGALLASLRNS